MNFYLYKQVIARERIIMRDKILAVMVNCQVIPHMSCIMCVNHNRNYKRKVTHRAYRKEKADDV